MVSNDQNKPLSAKAKVQPEAQDERVIRAVEPEVEALVCSDCGEENELDSLFCGECGASLKVDKLICGECNEENEQTSLCCENCGASLIESDNEVESTTITEAPPPEPQKPLNKEEILSQLKASKPVDKASKPAKPNLATDDQLKEAQEFFDARFKDRAGEVEEIMAKFKAMKRERVKTGDVPVLRLWKCNYTGTYHQSPDHCGEPWHGGAWHTLTPEKYERLMKS